MGVIHKGDMSFSWHRILSWFSGYGDLSVSIQGPSEAELRCIENKGGLAHIVYKPTEPGIYTLSVKFADVHVNG